MNFWRGLFKSVKRASGGLWRIFKEERSFRVQVLAAGVVCVFMVWLPLGFSERLVLILLIAAVLILEIFNSVLERLADALAPRLSYLVKDVKDMMAGAVLLMSVVAVIVGMMVLGGPALNTICDTLLICTTQTL